MLRWRRWGVGTYFLDNGRQIGRGTVFAESIHFYHLVFSLPLPDSDITRLNLESAKAFVFTTVELVVVRGWNLFSGQWKTNRPWDRWNKRTQASFSKKSLAFIKHQQMILTFENCSKICLLVFQNIQAHKIRGRSKHCIFSFMLLPPPHQTANQINGNIILSKWVVLTMKGEHLLLQDLKSVEFVNVLQGLSLEIVYFEWRLS